MILLPSLFWLAAQLQSPASQTFSLRMFCVFLMCSSTATSAIWQWFLFGLWPHRSIDTRLSVLIHDSESNIYSYSDIVLYYIFYTSRGACHWTTTVQWSLAIFGYRELGISPTLRCHTLDHMVPLPAFSVYFMEYLRNLAILANAQNNALSAVETMPNII